MTRYCPNCGAVVPDKNLNCPQCLTDVPREGWMNEEAHIHDVPTREEYRTRMEKRSKKFPLIMLLSILPGFIGLLGLGLIYRDHRDKKGYIFLLVGLPLFILFRVFELIGVATAGIGFIVTFIPMILCAFAYLLMAIVSIIDAFTGSLTMVGMGRN